MRYPASETAAKHQSILDAASRLYRRSGFDGVSVGEIMKAAGLTHGPFYNHFKSKQALIEACLEHISERAIAGLRDVPATEEGRREYCAGYLSVAHRDNVAEGCVIASLATEATREPRVQRAMAKHVERIVAAMASHFPWPSKRKARSESIRALITLVGAMVLARAVDNPALSDEILSEARVHATSR